MFVVQCACMGFSLTMTTVSIAVFQPHCSRLTAPIEFVYQDQTNCYPRLIKIFAPRIHFILLLNKY